MTANGDSPMTAFGDLLLTLDKRADSAHGTVQISLPPVCRSRGRARSVLVTAGVQIELAVDTDEVADQPGEYRGLIFGNQGVAIGDLDEPCVR